MSLLGTFLYSSNIRRSGNDRPAMIAYLYGPMLAMIIANIVMFIWLAVVFYKTNVEVSKITSITHANQT